MCNLFVEGPQQYAFSISEMWTSIQLHCVVNRFSLFFDYKRRAYSLRVANDTEADPKRPRVMATKSLNSKCSAACFESKFGVVSEHASAYGIFPLQPSFSTSSNALSSSSSSSDSSCFCKMCCIHPLTFVLLQTSQQQLQ